jgi:hypothetical protein
MVLTLGSCGTEIKSSGIDKSNYENIDGWLPAEEIGEMIVG